MHPLRSLALLLVAVALAPAARATTLVRLDPAQVDALAHRIVEARVVAAHEVQAGEGLSAIQYELAVERILKDDGSLARQVALRNGIVVIRQLGSLDPESRFVSVIGMPSYAIGARYRLALNGDSDIGLTSPVGLGQGVVRLPDAEPAAPAAPAGATP